MIPPAETFARAYEAALQALHGTSVQETGPGRIGELELQAKIFSGEFGLNWRGEDGESIEILHFGTWNREPGPDFCGARAVINGREVGGDIEIDGEARDWEAHGHSGNEAYDHVILHVIFRKGARRFFTRTSRNEMVPQICLGEPRALRAARTSALQGGLDESRAQRLIEAAAQFRLRRKTGNFQRAARLCGREDALFQALATGLGYKNNKIPFLLTAQRAGLERARGREGEALLFGLAGFLQAEFFDRGDEESRGYLRELWEAWWAIRGKESRLILPANAWKFAALRPANHPHRRMGALAGVAREFPRILRTLEAKSVDDFCTVLASLDHSYWCRHASLTQEPLAKETALIGGDRTLDLAINAFLPALGLPEAWERLKGLAGPTPSRKVLRATAWLVGAEKAGLIRSALQQQGLLQLHEDFLHHEPGLVWESFARSSG